MKSSQIRILFVSLLAVFAVGAISGIGASAASAECLLVAEEGKGTFEEPSCVGVEGTKEYIKVSKLETKLKGDEWCAKVETAKTGNFTTSACTVEKAKEEFVKVFTHGFWVCVEKNPGVEPPKKYDNHECNTQVKPLAERKWEWRPVRGATTFAFTSTSGPTILEGKIAGVRVLITCTKDTNTGIINAAGIITDLVITYEGCSLFEVKKYAKIALSACTVGTAGVIKTNALKGLLITGKGIGPEEEFEPESGTTFAEIPITGTGCSLVSTGKVTGKQICQLPEGPVGKVEHEVVCSPSGGELKYAGEPASYYGTDTIKLSGAAAGWGWGAE